MPNQIYSGEKTIFTLFIRALFVINMIQMALNLLLAKNLEWNPLPNYSANLFLICHMFATGTKLPGAMADFNRKIVEAATLKFGEIFTQLEYETTSQLDDHKYGLRYLGYRFISAWKNLGFAFMVLCLITKLVFVVSNILLFFVKTENRCGKLRLRKRYIHLLENISTPSYFNFEMSSSIIQLTCAFVYLRFSETYYSHMISATRIYHADLFLSVASLSSTCYLCIHLTVTAVNKGWWDLHKKLIERRGWYKKSYRELMRYQLQNKKD